MMSQYQYGTGFTRPATISRPLPRQGVDLGDTSTLVSLMIVAAMADGLRELSGIGYLVALLLAGLSLMRGISRRSVRDALSFMAIILVWTGMSFIHMLPSGWTTFYQASAILPQSLPLVGFCIMLIAFHRFWQRVLSGHIRERSLWAIVLVIFAIGPFVDAALGFSPYSRILGTLRNTSIFFLVITSHVAYTRRGPFILLLPLVYIALAVLTTYSQTRGFYLVSAFVLWAYAMRVNVSRLMVIVIVCTVTLVVAYLLLFLNDQGYAALWYADFNSGWRLAFWRDVFVSTWQTYGIGVGFGTEGLKNYYPQIPQKLFFPDPAAQPDFIMIGTHNAFTDALLRCGVAGFAALIWIFLNSGRIMKRRYSPSMAISFCAAFLCAFVNVALQSPLYSVGIAFALGYCRALSSIQNRTAQTPGTRASTAPNSRNA